MANPQKGHAGVEPRAYVQQELTHCGQLNQHIGAAARSGRRPPIWTQFSATLRSGTHALARRSNASPRSDRGPWWPYRCHAASPLRPMASTIKLYTSTFRVPRPPCLNLLFRAFIMFSFIVFGPSACHTSDTERYYAPRLAAEPPWFCNWDSSGRRLVPTPGHPSVQWVRPLGRRPLPISSFRWGIQLQRCPMPWAVK